MAATDTTEKGSRGPVLLVGVSIAVAAAVLATSAPVASRDGVVASVREAAPTFDIRFSPPAPSDDRVRVATIHYTAHDGGRSAATIVLPASYTPANNPPIPLVISPHGRNSDGRWNRLYWGKLPALGGFAVVNPDGMGRRLGKNSFGYPGQIEDLARMPAIVTKALPWIRVDRARIFALGSSMGGQEALLLVARHPSLLAGAAALDSITDLARRYRQMPYTECGPACVRRFGRPYGLILQQTLAREVGGTPATSPGLYAERSPLKLAARIAASGVPLEIWWSTEDRVVTDQAHQSGALYRELRRIDACAPVSARVGRWVHSQEMWSSRLLPLALGSFGLLPNAGRTLPASGLYVRAPTCSDV